MPVKYLKIVLLTALVFVCISAKSQSAKKLYKSGVKHLKSGNYSQSIQDLSKAIELKPGTGKYFLKRGAAYELQKDLPSGLKDYQSAFNLGEDEEWVYHKIADLSIKLSDFKTALAIENKLLTKSKFNMPALEKTALCHIMLKEYNATIIQCDASLSKKLYNHIIHYYKALALDSLHKYNDAHLSYEKAIKIMRGEEPNDKKPLPKYKEYYYNHGVCLTQLNVNDEALKQFEMALSVDPSNSEHPRNALLFFKRCQTYLNKADYINAIGDLNRAIVEDPKYKEAFMLRAEVYRKTSQFQSAISDYTMVLNLDSKNSKAYKYKGLSEYDLANYPATIDDLGKYLMLNPNDQEAKTKLDDAKNKLYEANRESDNPEFKLSYPPIEQKTYINIFVSQQDLLIEGDIKDKSLISSITVNGQEALFNKNEKNPSFYCKVATYNLEKVDIEVKDIYNNSSTKSYKIGRIVEDVKFRVNFSGKVISDDLEKRPLAGKKINLTNDKGEIFYTATTNNDGTFLFSKLPYDKNYQLEFDVSGTSLEGTKHFVLLNDKSEVVMKSSDPTKGKYIFEILQTDQTVMSMMTVDDAPLMIDLKGKLLADNETKSPLTNIHILLINDKGEIIGTKTTDETGLFLFSSLMPSQNYSLKVDETDGKGIPYNRVIITDDKSRIIKEISKDSKGVFEYKLLAAEKVQLSQIAEEISDPWIGAVKLNFSKNELTIIENIYYASGSFAIPPDGEKILDKALNALLGNSKLTLEIQAHTDAVASDDYNMDLSQKRAQAVADYLIKKGIDKKRLIAKGFGETALTNKCANGVDCSDAEHKQNRRTVFKLTYQEKK